MEWRKVPEWSNYSVCDRGEVRSDRSGKLLTKSLMYVSGRQYSKRAYYSVRLSDGVRRRRQPYVHILVLTAFAGPCPEGMEACHLNGNRLDNRWPENLEWNTHRANIDQAVAAGATNNGARKLNEDIVEVVRECLSLGITRGQIAKELGVSRQCIRNVDIGKTWPAKS
jgi:ribosomal protein S14